MVCLTTDVGSSAEANTSQYLVNSLTLGAGGYRNRQLKYQFAFCHLRRKRHGPLVLVGTL